MVNSFTPLVDAEHESLPLFLPSILDLDLDYNDYLIDFGYAKEIDLEKLGITQPVLTSRLKNYWLKTRSFFDDLASGLPLADYSLFHRLISSELQDTRKGSKIDLINSLKEIDSDPVLKEVISPLLDPELYQEFAHPYLISKYIDGLNINVTIEIPGKKDYNYHLGGLSSRAEIGRVFQITISHAKWRDRRVRKLVSVDVYAKELWPNE
jgi:hypothetical protein